LDLLRELVSRLVDSGCEVCLIGAADMAETVSDRPSNHVRDLAGRTPSPVDLAAVLAQMQAVVTCDSFPMHLAGALGIPTIVLFTTTDAVLGSDYPSVVAVQSAARCSPCRIAQGRCPHGHPACIAHHHPSLSPRHTVERVLSACAAARAV
jgi:ADP-heptose:LPS heptosyltransferase